MTFFEEGNRRIHMQIGKGADYRFSKIDLSIMAGRSGANQAKQKGFADRQIAHMLNCLEKPGTLFLVFNMQVL